MASRMEAVLGELREMILLGKLEPNERIVEIPFAARLGVSRTPLRLALAELEKEGLLERLTRGYRVREFTMEEIADAIDVRGTLEGMAARIVAERGLPASVRAVIEGCITEGRALLESPEEGAVIAQGWAAMNARLHGAIVSAAGNSALEAALRQNDRIPLAASSAITFGANIYDLSLMRRAHEDHESILEALVRGESARAESLLREHAYRSGVNKRILIQRMHRGQGEATRVPWLKLVAKGPR